VRDELDLAFTISSTAADADDTFQRIQETLKMIVDNYGTERVLYSVTVFDDRPLRLIRFNDKFPAAKLKRYIDLLNRKTGRPNLQKALQDAEYVFNSPGARPHSKKVLVVIVDRR
jgi:hypothetical protein